MPKNYYQILGVDKNATTEKIKEAYRKLAHKYHPDKASGDEKKFKEINEAYQILSNREKRAQYDQFGQVFSGQGGPAYGGQNPFGDFGFGFGQDGQEFNFNFDGASDLSDIFNAFFEGIGIRKKRRSYQGGADLESVQEITLEEAFRGVSKKIQYETFGICKKCGGFGYFEKEGTTRCPNCDGRGEISETRRSFFGAFSQIKSCSKCFGTGQLPKKLCADCSNSGRIKERKTVEIQIAPGTADNQLIKIAGAGETGERNAKTGDLYVKIKILPHHIFIRQGNDLLIKKDLNLIDVLLSKKIAIPVISGETIDIEVPEKFNLREKLKIHGQGMPKLGGYGSGDLYVDFQIHTPKKLNSKIKKILEDLEREL